jgi:hypothetical protein
VNTYDLRNGKSISCGCARKKTNSNQLIDLTGQQFGNWKVLKYEGHQQWLCECQCEKHTVKTVESYNLIHGKSKSCGCSKQNSSKLIDITNQKFGQLTVKKYIGGNKWLCQCSCGNMSIHYSHNLRRSNNTISCGCTEIKPYTKDEIIELIDKFKEQNNNEAPLRSDLCTLLDRGMSTVNRYVEKYNLDEYLNKVYRSRAEMELNMLFPTSYRGDRRLLDGMELDLYYPDKNIAIEFDGSYWHSELYKDSNYHQHKTLECAKKNIHLIHIFEYEWDNEKRKNSIIEIIKDMLYETKAIYERNTYINEKRKNSIIEIIKDMLYETKAIYERNTYIKEISKDIAEEFLNKYHIQGYSGANIRIGCIASETNEILGVMTLGTPRFNYNYQYEIVRIAWKSGISVIGGLEKMFKYFIKRYNPQSIITYCDISKFTGNSYIRLGFKPIQPEPITKPNYVWWNAVENTILTRYQTQKHKLIEKGLGTENQTEEEIMHSLQYYRIYDSGNIRLEWVK